VTRAQAFFLTVLLVVAPEVTSESARYAALGILLIGFSVEWWSA
jgi:hypothetical protein